MKDEILRARRSGFNAGVDYIANFINALDSEGMTGREVRSAIYSACLEARPPAAMLDVAPIPGEQIAENANCSGQGKSDG